MYAEFFGLNELPFALTPDPRYIYFTPSHTEVMANLHYGIESGKGLIVVTGEVGTGKTTMLRWVMQRLDRTVLVGYIFNPRLSVPEFYQHLATLFDIRNWETKSDLLFELGKILESRHSRGLRTVLIVDEAHGLSPAVLEEVRLLCNFESDTAKQLQIVLTGQPELRDVLNYPELRQLKQRVALRCEIRAMPNVQETAQYINSRLKVAGAHHADIFSPGAVDYIFRCSGGIPRAINNLCDNALLNGFAAGERVISRMIIQQVAETFDVLPRVTKVEEREAPARVFSTASRAELWSTGHAGINGQNNGHNGNGNGHVNGNDNANIHGNGNRYGNGNIHDNANIHGNGNRYANGNIHGNGNRYVNGNGHDDANIHGNRYANGDVHDNGNSYANGNGYGNGYRRDYDSEFVAISPDPEPDIVFNERPDSTNRLQNLTSALRRSGDRRGNNGQSL